MELQVNGHTKLFASIGDPVKHSISPQIHNSIFRINNLNCIHIPLRISPEKLKDYIHCIKNNFSGVSVTKPLKEVIIEHLDSLEDEARIYRAVNVIKNEEGILRGFNTDGYGFIKSLEENDVQIKGEEVLLLGSGGVARVVGFEILRLGGNLTIANRNVMNAEKLKKHLLSHWDSADIKVSSLEDLEPGYFGVINATPVGMYPLEHLMPIKTEVLDATHFVFDLIYNPDSTRLLDYSKSKGCKAINGLSMLFFQAVKAQEIWTSSKTDEKKLMKLKLEIKDYLNKYQ